VFGNTPYAAWYTRSVRWTCILINALFLIGGTVGLSLTYLNMSLHGPILLDPWRKITILSVLVFSIGSDLILTVLIFQIMIRLHRTLIQPDPLEPRTSPSGKGQLDQHKRLMRWIIGSVIGMLISSCIGITTYAVSKDSFSTFLLVGGLFLHVEAICEDRNLRVPVEQGRLTWNPPV
jgi:cytochrome c biogenesis protein CcdA